MSDRPPAPAPGAVFLSYASQDAEAARRLCEALRAAGVEVWFDQNELVGGDAWDAKIRGQIASCALFVPVISASTQARLEGYFRIEWKLAAQRTHAMADEKAFLLPVVIDDTRDGEAKVPGEFRAVQWTRLPGGVTPEKFCARVNQLLGGEPAAKAVDSGPVSPRPAQSKPASKGRWLVPAGALLLAAGAGAFVFTRKAEPAPGDKPSPTTAGRATEASELITQVWDQLNRPELARAELETAETLCRRASELEPNNPDVWAAWSQADTWSVYHNFNHTPERRESARTKATKALKLAPRSSEARLAEACYMVRAGGTPTTVSAFAPQAEATLAELLREKPEEPRALFALAILQRNLGRYEAMRSTFAQLARNPAFAASAWTELGWAEQTLGDYRAAEAAADRAVALREFWGSLSLKTEISLGWRGDLAAARAAFARMPTASLQEDFGIAEGSFLYFACREPKAMLRLLESASREWLRSNLFDGPAGYLIGKAYAMDGRPQAAEQHWQAALRLVERRLNEAPDAALMFWKARLQSSLGARDEARQTLKRAREMSGGAYLRGDRELEAAFDEVLIGSTDEALKLLEASAGQRRVPWAVLALEPDLDPLRSEPRFQSLVAQAKADPRRSPHAASSAPATSEKGNP